MSSIKIGIVSDLHTEHWDKQAFNIIGGKVRDRLKDADLILLAGDIGSSSKAIMAARQLFRQPVCMIAGNHEFYGYTVDETLLYMTETAQTSRNVNFLNRTAYISTKFGVPIRVLGATFWTDYDLFGNPPQSMLQAARFPDFQSIYKGEKTKVDFINMDDVLSLHKVDKAWLFDELAKPFDGVTVVMTHHAPVSFAIHPRYENDVWNPCFASRFENQLVRDDVNLVVWGHTHHAVDRTIDKTRFVSNQVGYSKVHIDHYGNRNLLSQTGEFGTVVEIWV